MQGPGSTPGYGVYGETEPMNGGPERATAVERAYNEIRNMIVRQQLRPGEKTSVVALANVTGIGRTPIKEAITRLSAEGLLAVKGRSGTFVARLGTRDIKNLFDLRRVFECYAAHRAVGRVTKDRVHRMESLLHEMWEETIGKSPEERSLPRFIDSDVGFHLEIISAADNPYLLRQFQSLNLQMQIVTYLFHAGGQSAKKRHREHREILEAFKHCDGDKLERALVSHATGVEVDTINAMSAQYGSASVAASRGSGPSGRPLL